jgi:molybdopterin-binding protein
MNTLNAAVTDVKSIDNLTVVSFDAAGIPLRMMALGLSPLPQIGSAVTLGFKSSHVALAKTISGEFSISNRLPCTIVSMNEGELLCSIRLGFAGTPIESIITLDSSRAMQLAVGSEVTALIKASELFILELNA